MNPQTPRRSLTPPPLSAPNRSSKNIAEPAQLWSLRARVDAHFPSNIGAKGSRREESRIFPKHRNAAEVHAELSETVRSDTDCPRLSLRACFNRRKFLNPQTLRRPLTPPPLSAPNRSSKNIAEPARLWNFRASRFRKFVRGVLQNRIVVGARANAEGGCGFGISQPYGGCFCCSPKLRIGRAKCDNIGSIENTCYCIEGR